MTESDYILVERLSALRLLADFTSDVSGPRVPIRDAYKLIDQQIKDDEAAISGKVTPDEDV